MSHDGEAAKVDEAEDTWIGAVRNVFCGCRLVFGHKILTLQPLHEF
jgi:hypothetical protein